ncbi:MAG: hypothetical protein ACK559_23415, partial [bacterium]
LQPLKLRRVGNAPQRHLLAKGKINLYRGRRVGVPTYNVTQVHRRSHPPSSVLPWDQACSPRQSRPPRA